MNKVLFKIHVPGRSKVFAAMFTHDTLENQNNVIEIVDVDYETMKALLEYIYCTKVQILEDVSASIKLFAAADKVTYYLILNLAEYIFGLRANSVF